MNKLIRQALTVMVSCLAITAQAASYRSVIVQRHDKTTLAVQGERGLSLVMSESEMKFLNAADQYIAIPLSEVKGWTYSDKAGDAQWSSVDGVHAEPSVIVSCDRNVLSLDKLSENCHVRLISISGMVIADVIASERLELPLTGLSSGIYILTCDTLTLKIVI